MNSYDTNLITLLASKTIEYLEKSNGEVEKICWMVVHEHHHGIMPFEYDIREIDENLYLAVLKLVKATVKI